MNRTIKVPWGTDAAQIFLRDTVTLEELESRITFYERQRDAWTAKAITETNPRYSECWKQYSESYQRGIDSMRSIRPLR